MILTHKSSKQTRYGFMHMLKDENGNNVVFYSDKNYSVKGDKWDIVGTVKEHKEHEGFKQTILKDVKVLNHINIDELSDEEIDQLFD